MIRPKNQMIRPKNFPIPRWEIRNSSGGIFGFLRWRFMRASNPGNYALQHFGDSLVLMVYDALLDRWSERSFSYTLS